MPEENATTTTTGTVEPNTSTVQPPAASTEVASAPAQTTEAASNAPVVPDGYVKAEEVETERTARTAAERERDEARAEAARIRTEARQEKITSVATRLGFNDVADAQAFLASDAEDIEAALKDVLEKKPYLAKATEVERPPVTPTSPTNPARKDSNAPVFTQAQIGNRDFWNANKAAILQAVKEGRIQA
jgi:glucose/arabinose dehydrogenase